MNRENIYLAIECNKLQMTLRLKYQNGKGTLRQTPVLPEKLQYAMVKSHEKGWQKQTY